MKQAIVYIGIDVAKAHLDVSWAKQARRFSNEKKGQAALVRWLKTSQMPVQLMHRVCEAVYWRLCLPRRSFEGGSAAKKELSAS